MTDKEFRKIFLERLSDIIKEDDKVYQVARASEAFGIYGVGIMAMAKEYEDFKILRRS